MMQARPVQRMIRGADPHETGDIAEPAHIGIGNVAIPVAIGIIPDRRMRHAAAAPDLGIRPQIAFGDLALGMDQRRFGGQSFHSLAPLPVRTRGTVPRLSAQTPLSSDRISLRRSQPDSVSMKITMMMMSMM